MPLGDGPQFLPAVSIGARDGGAGQASPAIASSEELAAPAALGNEVGSTFVFRPGGQAGGNVYTDWGSMIAAAVATPGPKSLQIDGSLAPAVVPAGTWNLDNCTLLASVPVGQIGTQAGSLTFANGAQLAFNFLRVGAFITLISNSQSPVISMAGSLMILQDGATLKCLAGAAPFISATGGTFSILVMTDYSNLVVSPSPGPVITVGVGSTLILDTSAAANGIPAHGIAGAGTCLLQLSSDSAFFAPQDVATLTTTLISKASQMSYTPASNANWNNSAPATVAAALDRIAAKITPIP